MSQELKQIIQDAEQAIQIADNLMDLDQVRVKFLGKKGQLTDLLKSLGSLSAEERPKVGQAVNEAKQQIQAWITEKTDQLKQHQLEQQLSAQAIDVTLPGKQLGSGSLHPVTLVRNRLELLFSEMGFDIAEGPEIEDEWYNFDALNIPTHHPARAEHDTFFTDDKRVLRTHTSPVQIRYMQTHEPPMRMVAPGRVYRCDFDASHTPMFHQLEALVIDKAINFAQLKGLLIELIHRFFETDAPLRFRPSYFPFTEPSAEVDIRCVICGGKGCNVCGSGWLEILGCGMVHPQVLKNGGIDPEKYTGYAIGLGIDRLTMLYYGIKDLRTLFENDLRFLSQF